MRRWVITIALLAQVLLGGLVLALLLNGGGWGDAAQRSATEVEVLVVVAAVALVGTLLLVPVLGISFWARDRSFRRQETELATLRHQTPGVEPPSLPSPDNPTASTSAPGPIKFPRVRRPVGRKSGTSGRHDLDDKA